MNWSQFGLMVIAGTLAAGLGMFLSRWLRRRRKYKEDTTSPKDILKK